MTSLARVSHILSQMQNLLAKHAEQLALVEQAHKKTKGESVSIDATNGDLLGYYCDRGTSGVCKSSMYDR